jgi:hypothetical protein
MLRNYRDKLLPQVPANENKIRLKHGTTSVKDSMAKGRGYRLAHDFPWRNRQAHAMADGSLLMAAPGEVDCRRSQPGPGPRGPSDENRAVSKARDLFTRDDLAKIFSASWFQIGHGQLTRAGTYRDFLPYYY